MWTQHHERSRLRTSLCSDGTGADEGEEEPCGMPRLLLCLAAISSADRHGNTGGGAAVRVIRASARSAGRVPPFTRPELWCWSGGTFKAVLFVEAAATDAAGARAYLQKPQSSIWCLFFPGFELWTRGRSFLLGFVVPIVLNLHYLRNIFVVVRQA